MSQPFDYAQGDNTWRVFRVLYIAVAKQREICHSECNEESFLLALI